MAVCLVAVVLGINVVGILADFAAAIRSPLQIDYGEGIVWQQALLVPGLDMYRSGQSLPFIVFHYPPIYYLLTHAIAPLAPNLLAAGRMVSVLSTLLLAPLVGTLVLLATPKHRRHGLVPMAALVAGLLVLSFTPVRLWGMLMRVDMPGLVFGFAGLVVAARADGRFVGTLLALLCCLLAVFTKQTLLCFGVAVFALALLQRPRQALAAATIVGTMGIAATLALQAQTAGGFLRNIIDYNINRFEPAHALEILALVWNNLAVMALAILAAAWLLVGIMARQSSEVPASVVPLGRQGPNLIQRLRLEDVVVRRRMLVLLHFALSCAMLVTLCKVGSGINYLLEWCCEGAVILGLVLADLLGRNPALAPSERPPFRDLLASRPTLITGAVVAACTLLPVGLLLPNRLLPDQDSAEQLGVAHQLVQRITAAPLPVASENMVLLMQAGRHVVFEPAIATELSHVGLWDETPLVEAIRRKKFAFMLTSDGTLQPTTRRTQAVNAAMRQAYPNLRQLEPDLWLHEP